MANIPGPIPLVWEVCTEIGITRQQPSIHFNNLVYAQVGVTPEYGPPPGIWTVADATQWGVPTDAKALLIAGIIGITPANPPTLSNLTVYFRELGDSSAINPPDFSYIMQASSSSEGVRTNGQCVVPLVEGKFEWAYNISTSSYGGPKWPSVPSYLINIGPMEWRR